MFTCCIFLVRSYRAYSQPRTFMRIILRKEQLLELNSRKHDRHSRKISRTSFKSKRGQIQPKNALWKKKCDCWVGTLFRTFLFVSDRSGLFRSIEIMLYHISFLSEVPNQVGSITILKGGCWYKVGLYQLQYK